MDARCGGGSTLSANGVAGLFKPLIGFNNPDINRLLRADAGAVLLSAVFISAVVFTGGGSGCEDLFRVFAQA